MKKAVKIFTAITAAAVAVAGAVYVVRKFFLHDDELEEFDVEELFEDEDDDSDDDGIEAFDDESEIFEDEAKEADKADAEKAEDTSESSEEPAEDSTEK